MDSGTRVGKYAVGRKLGQGGFGVLYIARDTELDREVAIKFLRPEHAFKPHVVQRFLQEARAAARISHPGIVTVFECGEVAGTNTRADGTVYIAMELLAGETLAARIRREKLPLGIAIGMGRQLAAALAAAHDAQIVHRDLKPSNVFLVPDGAIVGGERVKILDFGIAKLVDGWGATVQTHSMEMLGTPMYMSPEQCKSSSRVDARSDVYTLGCMLFELVTGRPPFDGDAGELIAKHQLVAPPLASQLSPSVPPALEALIARMLAKSPDDRPQTMIEVIDALDRAAAEPARHVGPLEASPFDPPTRADELATTVASQQRRPPRVVWLAAAVAVLLGVTIAVATTRGSADAVALAPRDAGPPIVVIATVPDAPPVDAAAPADAPPWDDDLVIDPIEGCDADAMLSGGTAEEARGNHVQALAQYDAALACRFDTHSLQLAFMAACNGTVLPSARRYWRQMSPDMQTHMLQICLHNHITAEMLGEEPDAATRELRAECRRQVAAKNWTAVSLCADKLKPEDPAAAEALKTRVRAEIKADVARAKAKACDSDDLLTAGTAAEARGNHVVALTNYDAALKCRFDTHSLQLAFLAACNGSRVEFARKYWKRMSPDMQSRMVNICAHNHITLDMLNESCDAGELVSAGNATEAAHDHAGALAKYDAALACKFDSHTLQLAFMAACDGARVEAARKYWKRMSPDQQSHMVQLCLHNHITADMLNQ